MANIHILRNHTLGLPAARKVAFKWTEQAQTELKVECTYEEGALQDEMSFQRSGVSGTLHVTKDKFELNAKLGFLLGAFKDRIEDEIVKNLDALLAKSAVHKKPATKKAAAKKA